MSTPAIRNEAIVTGGYGTVVAYMIGTLHDEDPWRVISIIVIWLSLGFALIQSAQRVLKEMA